MNEKTQRYPLAWPMNWKRTNVADRRRADFASHSKTVSTIGTQSVERTVRKPLTIAGAIDRLEGEIRRLGATNELLSTNVPVSLKGLPYSQATEPRDPGVALYFDLKKKPLCFACDKWDRVADNIAAIAQHIDALRRIDRYGVGRLEQAFAGYAALPPTAEDWRIVLGVGEYATIDQVNAAFLEKARAAHPDVGGSHDEMAKLTAARDLALKVLS